MRAYCQRCDAEVSAAYEHPRLRRVARGYLLLPVPFLPVLPIMASDYVVSLPLLMVWMLGLGPVYRIIQDPAICSDCGANVKKESEPPASRWRILRWAGRAGR